MTRQRPYILGIESSCDETSAAILEGTCTVRSCIISSSRKDFERMGGVIPERAAREQLRCIIPVVQQAMNDASAASNDLRAIAVTCGPGLLGSLLVGTATARVLAELWNIPLIPVHHTLGHLSSTWLTEHGETTVEPQFPILALSVSGGHTDLWLRRSHGEQTLIGRTIDDAAGEAFDKGAVQLGLPYPGGPALEALAAGGDKQAISFPIPRSNEQGLHLSYSGLKTSLKYLIRDAGGLEAIPQEQRQRIAASYQAAIVAQLIDRLEAALRMHADIREVHIVGGVSANGELRRAAADLAEKKQLILRVPKSLRYCTDNAAMIACAAALAEHEHRTISRQSFRTSASLPLEKIAN